MQRWLPLGTLLVSGACLLVGCAPAEVPTHSVRGQVFYRNKPLAEALIVFHVVDAAKQAANKPMAVTDAEGKFTLTSMKAGDGAPVGEYAITIDLRESVLVGEEKSRSGRSLLPERYRVPEKSGLRFRVEAGDNVVPRIDVKD